MRKELFPWAHSRVSRSPAWPIPSVILTLAALGPFALFGGEVWAERSPHGPPGYAHPGLQSRAPQVHDAADHEAPGASTDGAVHYLTINVDITDVGIEPASVFIPM